MAYSWRPPALNPFPGEAFERVTGNLAACFSLPEGSCFENLLAEIDEADERTGADRLTGED